MTIIFVRHAQTDWNTSLIPDGNLDLDVNNQGRVQLRKLNIQLEAILRSYRGNEILILSSPLKRALSTARSIAKFLEQSPRQAKEAGKGMSIGEPGDQPNIEEDRVTVGGEELGEYVNIEEDQANIEEDKVCIEKDNMSIKEHETEKADLLRIDDRILVVDSLQERSYHVPNIQSDDEFEGQVAAGIQEVFRYINEENPKCTIVVSHAEWIKSVLRRCNVLFEKIAFAQCVFVEESEFFKELKG